MSAFDDIGPTAPSRMELYRQAQEVELLAKEARSFATQGPQMDLPRAQARLNRIKHLMGVRDA